MLRVAALVAVLAGCSAASMDETTFLAALGPLRGRVFHDERFEPYRLRYGGSLGRIVLLHGRSAPCGSGIRGGGAEAPAELPVDRGLRGVLVLDDSGKPGIQIDEYRCSMAVVDADGDGRAEELLRWRDFCDYDRPPFIVLHDLSRPGVPVMACLELNPQAARESLIMDVLPHPDGNAATVTSRTKRVPARRGRWRFDRGADLVVEEWKGEAFAEVARYRFDPRERRWIGPPGGPDAFWQAGKDPALGARITRY